MHEGEKSLCWIGDVEDYWESGEQRFPFVVV